MDRLIWTTTESALQDLDEIANYIALDDYQAASNLVKQVFKSVERLELFPESGKKPFELFGTPYREIVVGPCRIFYRMEAQTIYVLYVMRTERLLRKYLLKARDKKNKNAR